MPHVYSLDGEHFSKGLSVSCEILPRITVILQEMGAESVLHLRPLPERHFGLLAQPMQPCSPTSMLGGVQPSGGIPLVMVLQRMGRRGLQTSSYWSKTPKCREFYEICAFSSCPLFISIHARPWKMPWNQLQVGVLLVKAIAGTPSGGRLPPALGCAMGLFTGWLRASVRLFGNAVTQDVLSKGKMHYSFLI